MRAAWSAAPVVRRPVPSSEPVAATESCEAPSPDVPIGMLREVFLERLRGGVAGAASGKPGSRDGVPELSGQTPPCDTGVYVTGDALAPPVVAGVRLSMHWLRARESMQFLQAIVRDFLPGDWKWVMVPRSMLFRSKHLVGPHGVRIAFDEDDDGRPVKSILEFPGQACEVVGPRMWHMLCHFHHDCLNRIDVAFDGVKGPDGENLSPRWVAQQLELSHDFIRSRVDREKCEVRMTGLCPDGKKTATVYIGSKSSDRFVRIYDQREETRVELVLQGHYAKQLGDHILRGVDVRKACIGFLRDHVDFVETGRAKNISRADLQAWWGRVVDAWDRIQIPKPVKHVDIEATWHWLGYSVSASIAAVVQAAGGDLSVLDKLVEYGFGRMRPRHRQRADSAGPEYQFPELGLRGRKKGSGTG